MTDTLTKETLVTTDVDKSNTTLNAPSIKADKSQTGAYIIYFIFGVIEILLTFRLVFKLTGANPLSSFVSFIYSLSEIFIIPFRGIFPQTTSQGVVTSSVLEPATLVAMVVYAVFAWVIAQLVVILSGKVKE